MFRLIKGLPDHVLGVEARGRVTDADYREVLIPEVEKKLARHKALRLFYVAGKDFYGYDAHAMWDDTAFALEHWTSFSGIALVTDIAWLRAIAQAFAPLFPGVVKVFGLADRREAEKWIGTGAKPAKPSRQKPAAQKKPKKKQPAVTKNAGRKKPAAKNTVPRKTPKKPAAPQKVKKAPAPRKKIRKKK